jgi:adenylate cyclase
MRLGLCLIVAVLGFSLQVWSPGLLQRLSLPLEDFKLNLRNHLSLAPPVRTDVVTVVVDERSVNHLGRWPWDRTTIAKLIRGLSEARVVGLDIVFSEKTTPEDDAALAHAFAENGNIVAGFFFRQEASLWGEEDIDLLSMSAYRSIEIGSPEVRLKEFPYSEVNIRPLAEAAVAQAFFSTEPDPDGLYRRYPLAFIHRGELYPPLAVQMMRVAFNREVHLHLDADGIDRFTLGTTEIADANYLRLNYSKLTPEQYVSALDIINGTVAPEVFRDKLVLVGVTELGVYDLRPTPVDPVTPGVWLHATALSNLLSNAVVSTSRLGDTLLLLLAISLTIAASIYRILWRRILLYAGVVLLIYAASFFTFVASDIWLREFVPLLAFLWLASSLETHRLLRTEGQARHIRRAFSSYVEPRVVEEILKNPDGLELGGSAREITILFSDIRGFSALAEKLEPQRLVQMLNRIHDPFTQAIFAQSGTLDKFIGDAVMALYNAPLDLEGHPRRAVTTALRMVESLVEVNAQFAAEGLPQLRVGVGVNTGTCIVGNIGSTHRFDYTAIGDPVNLASRLEALCKTYGTAILISEFTRSQIGDEFMLRLVDKVRVVGKEEAVNIYEVKAEDPELRQRYVAFESILGGYFRGEFAVAGEAFARMATEWGDPVAAVFAKRCEAFLASPPGADWDGVYAPKSK